MYIAFITAFIMLTPSAETVMGPVWACDSAILSRVLGVAPDGSFVVVEERRDAPFDDRGDGVDRVDTPEDDKQTNANTTTVEIRDRDGHIKTRVILCSGSCAEIECYWNGENKDDYCRKSGLSLRENDVWAAGPVGKALPVPLAEPAVFLSRLADKLGLTPLTPTAMPLSLDQIDGDDYRYWLPHRSWLSVASPDGPIPVTSVADISWEHSDFKVEIAAYNHKNSPLVFVQVNQWAGKGCAWTTSVGWFSPSIVVTRRPFANVLLLPEDTPNAAGEKIASLTRFITAEPGFFEARMALARLLRAMKVTRAEAMKGLSMPFPKGMDVSREQRNRYVSNIRELRGYPYDPAFERWLGDHIQALDAVADYVASEFDRR